MESSTPRAGILLALLCVVALNGCSTWLPTKDPLFRKLISVAADDYMGHELLEAGDTLALEETVMALQSEGFFEDFAVLPDVDHQFCGTIQVPISGTARGVEPEGKDSYWLKRSATLLSPGYAVAFDIDEKCRVVRVRGWKVMPNTL